MSSIIKSELKEQKIWLMRYEWIEWVEFFLLQHKRHTEIDFFTQTLNSLYLSYSQMGAQGAKDLAGCIKSEHSESNFLFFNTGRLFSHRHSTHSISTQIKSEIKEQKIWLMHYKSTQSVEFSLLQHRSTFSHRHSTHSISTQIKSEIKAQKIWLMHYEWTQSVEFSLL